MVASTTIRRLRFIFLLILSNSFLHQITNYASAQDDCTIRRKKFVIRRGVELSCGKVWRMNSKMRKRYCKNYNKVQEFCAGICKRETDCQCTNFPFRFKDKGNKTTCKSILKFSTGKIRRRCNSSKAIQRYCPGLCKPECSDSLAPKREDEEVLRCERMVGCLPCLEGSVDEGGNCEACNTSELCDYPSDARGKAMCIKDIKAECLPAASEIEI